MATRATIPPTTPPAMTPGLFLNARPVCALVVEVGAVVVLESEDEDDAIDVTVLDVNVLDELVDVDDDDVVLEDDDAVVVPLTEVVALELEADELVEPEAERAGPLDVE